MVELASEIRLAVDSGETAIGLREVIKSLRADKAKLIILAVRGEEKASGNVEHAARIANVPMVRYSGTSADLGTVCGKPFPVSMLSIIDSGNSRILELKGE